ncbi:MAG: hypothetical protein B6U69_02815 [Thermofilum sp. ex4484_15]|nr:MAG: hypothetical protein B6U69_02815 [Thermofilum sp. ex4484_15]
MKVVCTGISGSGRVEYLNKVITASRKEGKPLELMNIGEMMFEAAKRLGREIKEEKILDIPQPTLDWLRAAVFEQVLRRIYSNEGRDYIISTHAAFRWKKYLLPAFDFFYLNELSPDIYVTIIDDIFSIKYRLESNPQWKGRLNLREIAIWQDEEVFITKMLASYQRRPHYIIALREPGETLYDIMYSDKRKAYLSFPITHVKAIEDHLKGVRRFKEELRKYFVVFDPMTINDMERLYKVKEACEKGVDKVTLEVDGGELKVDVKEVLEAEEDIKSQTVRRDYLLIDQSDVVVVYYPVAVMSPGVLAEMIYGFSNNKDVYVIFTGSKGKSPFFEYYATKIFSSVDEFFNYIVEEGLTQRPVKEEVKELA